MSLNSFLEPSRPHKLAVGLASPVVEILSDGRILVMAYDTPANRILQILGDPGGDQFELAPVLIRDVEKLHIEDSFISLGRNGASQFLILTGSFDGQRGHHLFARNATGDAFVHTGMRPAFWPATTRSRPTLESHPAGTLSFVYSDPGGWLYKTSIPPNGNSFVPDEVVCCQVQNFGAAIDPQTGQIVAGDSSGSLREMQTPDNWTQTSLGLVSDYWGNQHPNRRTFATSTTGEAIFIHGQAGDDPPHFYRRKAGNWTIFSELETLRVSSARVHFHPDTSQFVILGRIRGKLAFLTVAPSDFSVGTPVAVPETERPNSYVDVWINRRAPDGVFSPKVRFEWGLFTGSKQEAILPPNQIQPINRQMNLHGGFNLNKYHRYQLAYPDPARGYGALYMDSNAVQRVISRVRQDAAYRNNLREDGDTHPIVDLWTASSPQAIAELVETRLADVRRFWDVFLNRNGVMDWRAFYNNGSDAMGRWGLILDTYLADQRITETQKTALKAAQALLGYIMWDEDYVPLFDGHHLSFGATNQRERQEGQRNFFALLLSQHSFMQEKLAPIESQSRDLVAATINDAGAEQGSPQYNGAPMGPALNVFLQLQRAGVADAFASEPRLARFGEFLMSLLTPPETRFGGVRKNIGLGDGATSAPDILLGPLATGLRASHPELSAQMMEMWHQAGRPHGSFYGNTFLKIDEYAPQAVPALTDITFSGYHTVLRHGWNTPNESTLWFINGDFYYNHRHNDYGNLIIYALGAPLSLDYGSYFEPVTSSSYLHAVITPEATSGHPWNQGGVPFQNTPQWNKSEAKEFYSLPSVATATAEFSNRSGLKWQRKIQSLRAREAAPLYLIDLRKSGVNLKRQ